MAEYIEREIAKKAFQDMDSGRSDGWTTSLSPEEAADYLAEYLDDIPAADVSPIKHGHWEYDKHFRFARCSECEAEFYICDLEEISGGNLVKYCPNCGAKMDGGENNGT